LKSRAHLKSLEGKTDHPSLVSFFEHLSANDDLSADDDNMVVDESLHGFDVLDVLDNDFGGKLFMAGEQVDSLTKVYEEVNAQLNEDPYISAM
jgi:hypothetical protein